MIKNKHLLDDRNVDFFFSYSEHICTTEPALCVGYLYIHVKLCKKIQMLLCIWLVNFCF